MTPEEKRQGAFEEFDELLAIRVAVDDAVVRAAEDNELKPEVFRIIAEEQFGDLHEHARNIQLRALNGAISAEVKIASSKRHPKNLLRDCYDLDEVAMKVEHRLGRPITEAEVSKIEEARRDFVKTQVKSLIGQYR